MNDVDKTSDYFSWVIWAMSFLPEDKKKRKRTITMIISVFVIILSIWFTSGFCALVGTESWMFAPTLVTGVIAGIFGFVNFINSLVV